MHGSGAEHGSAESLRAFVALDLDPPTQRRIGRVSDRLRLGSGAPSATWTPLSKVHVTLKFLGDVAPEFAVVLGRSLRPLAEGKAAPAPCALRLGAFPSIVDARIVVAELTDEAGEIAKLAATVDDLSAKIGVTKEGRRFRPHVTLARLKRPFDARKWLRPELTEGLAPCQITDLTLYRSHLKPEGAEYVPIARYAFASADVR